MFTKRQWYLSILFIVLAWSSAVAQNQTTTSTQTYAPDFNIMINRKSVRFTSQTQVLEWRVEVYSQTGELVFASGQQSNSELEWPLLDQKDKPVESGLYAYTLTIKNQTGEGNYVQRGHVIVDRASTSDRVWVTSDKAIGVGAGNDGSKLTVAGTSETTVGGADVSEKTGRSSAEGRTGAERKTQGKEASDQSASTAIATADLIGSLTGEGTPGQIPKWAGPNELTNSVMTEANGNIGVGTATPTSKLHAVAGIIGDAVTGTASAGIGVSGSGSTGVKGTGSYGVVGQGTIGVSGTGSGAGVGVQGSSTSGYGVSGNSTSSSGVYGKTASSNNAGVYGTSTGSGGTGIIGQSSTGVGVMGLSSSSSYAAVQGSNTGLGMGVRGVSSGGGTGVYGQSSNGDNAGVAGFHSGSGNGPGVYGQSNNTGPGVFGLNSAGGIGVSGSGVLGVTGNGSNIGVQGSSTAGTGVVGTSSSSTGVSGATSTGVGVIGSSSGNGFAMQAIGNTKQSLGKGGWVKAMIRVKFFDDAYEGQTFNLQCFRGDEQANGATANTCDGFSATFLGPATHLKDAGFNDFEITFPFDISGCFKLVSVNGSATFADSDFDSDTHNGNRTAVLSESDTKKIRVRIYINGGPLQHASSYDSEKFTLILF